MTQYAAENVIYAIGERYLATEPVFLDKISGVRPCILLSQRCSRTLFEWLRVFFFVCPKMNWISWTIILLGWLALGLGLTYLLGRFVRGVEAP
jgi:hypothetical protein